MTFGEKIKKIRVEKKMSQAQIARKMNISQQAYAKYEKTSDIPKFTTCRRIAEALKCEITDLLTFPDDFKFTAQEYYDDFVEQEKEKKTEEFNIIIAAAKKDTVFMENIIKLWRLPMNHREYVYKSIKNEMRDYNEEKEKQKKKETGTA